MTEIPATGAATDAHNLPELTVGELAGALKRTLEERFGRVRVRGEISGFTRARSGHLYFSLKDEDAVLDAVCWKGVAGRLSVAPEDGLEVVCTGRITAYAPRSRYQIVVEAIEVAGEGALLKLLEDRRKKLAAEGLFDDARKRPLPFLPRVIGVVTSPTGAVIRDILHRLADRFPRHVLLWPVSVQGQGAAAQIAAAIAGFNRLAPDGAVPRPDLVIVARGGGSLEDLMAFNEEIVVRAAAASEIPLISAVGHETDTTLIDFAADRRAPTPTAAAEIAVPVRAELRAAVLDAESRLLRTMARGLDERRLHVAGLARGLPDAATLVETATQRLDDWTARLHNAPGRLIDRQAGRAAEWGARLPHPRERLADSGHRLAQLSQRLTADARHRLGESAGALKATASGLRAGPLRERVRWGGETADALGARLAGAGRRALADGERRLETLSRLLESASYARVLERGFALVRDADGAAVTAAAATRPGMGLSIQFRDGDIAATVDGAPGPRPRRRRSAAAEDEDQGRLL